MRLDKKWLFIGLLSGLAFAAMVYAQTAGQILQTVYDSSNTALRINVVTSSGS